MHPYREPPPDGRATSASRSVQHRCDAPSHAAPACEHSALDRLHTELASLRHVLHRTVWFARIASLVTLSLTASAAFIGLAVGSGSLSVGTDAAAAPPPMHGDEPTIEPPPALPPATPVSIAAACPEPALDHIHDPAVLLARALRMSEAGEDVAVVRQHLTSAEVLRLESSALRSHVHPVHVGLDLRGLRVERIAWPGDHAAGVHAGDLVLSVNGHALGAPAAALQAYEEAKAQRHVVLDVLRQGQWIVLSVTWD